MAARRVRAVAAHVVAPRREPPQEISVSGAASTASGGGPQTTAAVPVVDVSPFLSHQRQPDGNYSDSSGSSDDTAAAAAAVVAAVGTACRDVGFMVVTGHGIDPSLTQRCADEASGFFSQPEPTKLQVAAKGGAFGYIPLNSEALGDDGDAALRPDLREAFAMGPVGNLRPQLDPASLSAHDREVLDFCYQPTPWPGQPQAADSDGAGLRTAMEQLYLATATLGDGLLRIFGQALGIDEALLLSKTTHHFSAMAAINYPALRQQLQGQALRPGQLRCGPHQDSGTLTIVWENAEGLEVLPRGSTTWQPVACPQDGLIVNVGDLMTRWTNGRWLSTPHRVRVPDPTEASVDSGRLSIAWFQNLSWDAEISNLIECEEALYPPITQGQLFWEREGPQRPGRRTDAQ